MPRRTLIVVCGIALAVVVALMARRAPNQVPTPPPPRSATHLPSLPAASEPPPSVDHEPASAPEATSSPAERLHQACGLAAEHRCEGDVCASVVVVPDLDSLGGWLSLAASSPGFVATVALRDAGVPLGALPCAHAVDALVSGGPVHAVELADGTEIWCSAGAAAGTEAAIGLCNALATVAHGPDAAQFDVPGLRELTLRR